LITAAIALPVVAEETLEPVSGPATATQVATAVTPVATDVVTVFNTREMLPIVQQASINAARQAGAAIAFGRSAGVGMVGLYRGSTPVQLPAPGFAYSMGVTVLPPEVVGNTMGRSVSAVLAPDAVVMGQTSAGLRGAQAGDSMLLVSASGGGVWFRIAAVLADATIGGAELLMTPDASERLGITQTSRAVMWNPSSRAAMDQALAANGLVSTSIRIRRSWDPKDPDETLGLSRTKALLGEFTYRVNGDGSVTQEAAWQAANLPSGRRALGLGINARCHLVIEPGIRAALAEVASRGLGGTINVGNTNEAGGCHNPRFNRLTPSSTLGFLSRHAWAAAIDMNTVGSCQGCAPPDFATLPGGCTTVQIFRKYGFAWGGNFLTPDGMHFEYVGERRDLLPYPSRWCQNTGAAALTAAEAGIGTFFATDGLTAEG
jgi:hypothetical protein